MKLHVLLSTLPVYILWYKLLYYLRQGVFDKLKLRTVTMICKSVMVLDNP